MHGLRAKKVLGITVAAALCASVAAFAACETQAQASDESQAYVVSVEQTENGYSVTYSDGRVEQLTSTAGKDGKDGEDGKDGSDLTIEDIYNTYVAETGSDMTLAQFIEQYLTISADDTGSSQISRSLLSSVSVYAEFVETTVVSGGFPGMGGITTSQIAQSGGSGVIYGIDDDYVYILTNYHVVYDSAADENKNGGSLIGREIYCYLYGSEFSPVLAGYDDEGYYEYDYGDTAISCEYIGGSMQYDLAVLRADKDDVFAINDGVKAVELADGYSVGEEVYAIGNAEAEGITATAGIVSVDSEYINLDIDENGQYESYRSIRFDAAIYHGNSGGGLFNSDGELIGITNAGADSNENICYAIPVSIVKGAADNIIYYATDGDESTEGVYAADSGLTVEGRNAKYSLGSTGIGSITEEIYVTSVESGSAADELGLTEGDRLTSIIINGTAHELSRAFDIDDIMLTVREGDELQFVYMRGGEQATTEKYAAADDQFLRAA